jgi:restriction system protein
MPVPTYDKFIEPVLRYLAQHPDGATASEVHDAAAAALGLSEADLDERLPSGVQRVYKNRAGWAHDRLKRAGLSQTPRRGFWKLTESGVELSRSQPGPMSEDDVWEIAAGNHEVRLRPLSDSDTPASVPVVEPIVAATASPDDRLEEAVAELRATTTAELLETLGSVSPKFFETIVLDVLHKMGYGANRSDLQRVGGSGDGGIDGVISLDRLGLEKVYVQAKRWQSSVGRPEVQGFYGALAGQRAAKGVFITTSTFTAQAIEFARSVERIVLVDGVRLAELMIDYEVGVTMRPIRVPKMDTDYFEEQ